MSYIPRIPGETEEEWTTRAMTAKQGTTPPPNKLLDGMQEIFHDAMRIARDKNHDYAGEVDPLANFRTFGWKGVIVRISDKWQRLVNFYSKPVFKWESFEDTIKDMINYLAISLVMYREENKAAAKPTFQTETFRKYPALFDIDKAQEVTRVLREACDEAKAKAKPWVQQELPFDAPKAFDPRTQTTFELQALRDKISVELDRRR